MEYSTWFKIAQTKPIADNSCISPLHPCLSVRQHPSIHTDGEVRPVVVEQPPCRCPAFSTRICLLVFLCQGQNEFCPHGNTQDTRSKCASNGLRPGPFFRDLYAQNSLNPFLCQLITVSGFTTMRTFFKSFQSLDKPKPG